MIDLETLSTSPNASILVIAAIKFDRFKKDKRESEVFCKKIDSNSCTKLNLDIEKSTVEWWEKQPKKIRNDAFGGTRIDLKKALEKFSTWFTDSTYIWSNGACFDIPILENAYRKCNLIIPWKYYNVRDTRTIYDLAGIKPWDLPQGDLHSALADCERQIWGVHKSMLKLKLL